MRSFREQTWNNFAAGLLAILLGLLIWVHVAHWLGYLVCTAGALLAGNAVYVLLHLRNRHEDL